MLNNAIYFLLVCCCNAFIDLFEVGKMKRDYVLVNCISLEREKKGLSQLDLAKIVGISRNALSLIELGKMGCSAYVAARLCVALDLPFEDLFFLAPKR